MPHKIKLTQKASDRVFWDHLPNFYEVTLVAGRVLEVEELSQPMQDALVVTISQAGVPVEPILMETDEPANYWPTLNAEAARMSRF